MRWRNVAAVTSLPSQGGCLHGYLKAEQIPSGQFFRQLQIAEAIERNKATTIGERPDRPLQLAPVASDSLCRASEAQDLKKGVGGRPQAAADSWTFPK